MLAQADRLDVAEQWVLLVLLVALAESALTAEHWVLSLLLVSAEEGVRWRRSARYVSQSKPHTHPTSSLELFLLQAELPRRSLANPQAPIQVHVSWSRGGCGRRRRSRKEALFAFWLSFAFACAFASFPFAGVAPPPGQGHSLELLGCHAQHLRGLLQRLHELCQLIVRISFFCFLRGLRCGWVVLSLPVLVLGCFPRGCCGGTCGGTMPGNCVSRAVRRALKS
eukprot:5592337-Amphidinium_carterae.2